MQHFSDQPLPNINQLNDVQEHGTNAFRRVLGGTILAVGLGALAFQQSPLNESLRASEAVEVIDEGGDPFDVGLTVAGITAVIETVSSGLIVTGLNYEEGPMKRKISESKAKKERRKLAREERKRLKRRGDSLDFDDENLESDSSDSSEDIKADTDAPKIIDGALQTAKYVGLSLGIGAGMVVIDKHLDSKETSLKKDIGHSIGATAIVSAFSGGIAYLSAGGLEKLDDTPLEGASEWIVDRATDPKSWALLLGPYMLYRFGVWVSDVRAEKKTNVSNDSDVEEQLQIYETEQ